VQEDYRTPGWLKATLLILALLLLGCLALIINYNVGMDDSQGNNPIEENSSETITGNQKKLEPRKTGAEEVIIGPTNIADIVEIVSPAVVNVEASRKAQGYGSNYLFNDPFFKEFFGDNFTTPRPDIESAIGTGFIISKEGHIITNQHVIDGAETIQVNLSDGSKLEAEVVGQDYEMDLAILKINTDIDLIPLKIGDSDDLRVGEWVIAIGNPYGLDHTVTAGVVSAKGRPMQIENRIYKDLIQTDAAINPGNSGGPLLNTSGEVVGINTAVNAKAQGIGFAISINTASDVLDDLMKNGKVIRPYIGIYLQPVDQEIADYMDIDVRGIIVVGVEPDSPADKADLRKYDIITRINEQNVNNYNELQEILKDNGVGDTIMLEVIREGRPTIVPIKLAEKP